MRDGSEARLTVSGATIYAVTICVDIWDLLDL
jgi:hypothetical protein